MKRERKYYLINENTARLAHSMNSMRDFAEGRATAEYRQMCDEAYDLAEKCITERDLIAVNAETVWYLAQRYAFKLAAWQNESNANEASCPSIMISGGSNFPVNKKNKQNARRNSLSKEYDYISGLLVKIRNIAHNNAIKSGDPNAVELIELRIEKLQTEQEEMKAANAHYRRHKTMLGFGTYTDEQAAKVDAEIESNAIPWCRIPAPAYALSNNSGNIRRLKQRLEQIKRDKDIAATGGATYETHGMCEVREDEADMRIRLIFPGKPDDITRTVLKSHGFVWSPKATAWQRQLNNNGRYAVKRVLEELKGKG